MARNDRAFAKVNKTMQGLAQGISSGIDDLHRVTYMSTPQQGKDLSNLSDRINQNIDNIQAANMNAIGEPSITKLYTRLAATSLRNGQEKALDLDSIFELGTISEDLYGLLASNRYLKELDVEIDSVCKYMPRLEEALDVQKDCVLSADHFSKDFLNVTCTATASVDPTVFAERIKDLKKKYKLPRLAEEIYEATSKYGEQFIYRVPYKTAIGRLLATKPDASSLIPPTRFSESVEEVSSEPEYFLLHMNHENCIIRGHDGYTNLTESAKHNVQELDKASRTFKQVARSIIPEQSSITIPIEISRSNVLESAVKAHKEAMDKLPSYKKSSMASLFEATRDIKAKGNINWGENPIDDRIITANDGLVPGNKVKPVDLDVYGCVVKKLSRYNLIPIYIEDICMGYYYFEIKNLDNSDPALNIKNLFGDPLNNMKGNLSGLDTDVAKHDDAVRFIAGQLSKFIDRKFVNHNQDLAREIYMILKYNDLFNSTSMDMIKVTFIPPEDILHFYFNLDQDTHRGISDLAKSLIPAKIYSTMYITDSIAHMTRGQDKRVYYVKQTVDTNIASTLLNTIQQIKQGNFGIRNFNSINNVLNITGKFNDFVIPTNASGEPPIQFEIMPGQDIKTPTELMENLEQMAVNATGVPYEIIQTRQSVDYAMQLTMSSSKVLRWTYKRQELYEISLSDLITSIYNYEYNDSIELVVKLPPPSFINVTNTNQLVDNTKAFVQSIVEVELANEDDEQLKNQYSAMLFNHYIGTHIDTATHKTILEQARLKVKTERNESHSDTAGGSEY